MYSLNHIIVIVFNYTRAYARVTLVKKKKQKKKKEKKKKVVRIANLQTIKTKSSQFFSPMYYLFIVLGIYAHGSFSLWNYVHGSLFLFLDLENGKNFHQKIWYHKKIHNFCHNFPCD